MRAPALPVSTAVLLACGTPPAEVPAGPPAGVTATAAPVEPEPEPEPEPEEETAADPVEPLRPSQWPEEIGWPPAFDARHATIEVGSAGDLRVHASVERRDVSALADAWLRALADSGYAPSEPCVRADSIECTLHDAQRDRMARLAVAHNPNNDTWSWAKLSFLPAGHTPTTKLPGKCVTPPERRRTFMISYDGVDQEGEFFSSRGERVLATGPGPDLDGDGAPETVVPARRGGDCPWDVPYDVYVMRGSCGHHVGRLVGPIDRSTFLSPFHNGLREVTTVADWAESRTSPIPTAFTHTRAFSFDGTRFRATGEKRTEGKCHHCAAAWCTERK